MRGRPGTQGEQSDRSHTAVLGTADFLRIAERNTCAHATDVFARRSTDGGADPANDDQPSGEDMDSMGVRGRAILFAQRFWQPTSACLTCMPGSLSKLGSVGHWEIALQTARLRMSLKTEPGACV